MTASAKKAVPGIIFIQFVLIELLVILKQVSFCVSFIRTQNLFKGNYCFSASDPQLLSLFVFFHNALN